MNSVVFCSCFVSTPPRLRSPLDWFGISLVPRTEVCVVDVEGIEPSTAALQGQPAPIAVTPVLSVSVARSGERVLAKYDVAKASSGRPGTRTLNGFLRRSCFQNSVLILPDAFRVRLDPNLESRISNLESRISNLESRISDFRFQISDFRFQISDFRFQISDFRFQISDFRFSRPRLAPPTGFEPATT